MVEQRLERGGRRRARMGVWAVVAIGCVLAAGAGSYAATDGWTDWPWGMITIHPEGVITDGNGDVMGEAVSNGDGSFNAHIMVNGQEGVLEITPVNPDELPPDQPLKLFVAP